MSRLIDADELIPLIKMGEMNEYTEFGEGRNSGIAFAVERINQMPTVEPERKKGNWVGIDDVFECDQCGAIYYDTENSTWNLPNYCPSCGADMRGEAE